MSKIKHFSRILYRVFFFRVFRIFVFCYLSIKKFFEIFFVLIVLRKCVFKLNCINKLFFDSNLRISVQIISRVLKTRKTRDSSCELNRNYRLLLEKLNQKHQIFDVHLIMSLSIIAQLIQRSS